MKRIVNIFTVILFFQAIVFCYPANVFAAGDQILITEIYPSPNAGENEWIELYNDSSNSVSLIGYTIEDGAAKPKKLDSYAIPANNYIVLEQKKDFTFSLNNSGDIIILKHSGKIVDSLTYGDWDDGAILDNAVCPEKGQSISRQDIANSGINYNDFIYSKPTKGVKYEKIIYSNVLVISEILPHLSSSATEEFIEIYNNSSETVDLTGWQLDDSVGGSAPFVIKNGTTIMANSYRAFFKSETKLALNDDGDAVRLIDPNNEVRSQIYYGQTRAGESFAQFNNFMQWTAFPTPGCENILAIPLIEPVVVTASTQSNNLNINIAEVKQSAVYSNVTTTGVVTVPPGALSSQYGYIQDITGGIQLYSYKKDFPTLEIGDEVSIHGVLSEISDEKRLKTGSSLDTLIISHGNIILPKSVLVSGFNPSLVGSLVRLSGVIADKETDNFQVFTDDQQSVKVMIRDNIRDSIRPLKNSQKIEIIGIVSIYKDKYRILPISVTGGIIQHQELPQTGPNINLFIYFLLALVPTWIICQQPKMKPKISRFN